MPDRHADCCPCRWPAPTITRAIAVAPGDFVVVPLGPREMIGVVWGAGHRRGAGAPLQAGDRELERPPCPRSTRRFIEWVADYTLAPPRRGAAMAMSVSAARASRRGRSPPGACPGAGWWRRAMLPARRARVRAVRLAEAGAPTSSATWRAGGRRLRRGQGPGRAAGLIEVVALPLDPALRLPDPGPCRRDAVAGPAGRGAPPARRLVRDAASGRRCSTASPARARPRSISRPSPRRCAAEAPGRWCCCPRSR